MSPEVASHPFPFARSTPRLPVRLLSCMFASHLIRLLSFTLLTFAESARSSAGASNRDVTKYSEALVISTQGSWVEPVNVVPMSHTCPKINTEQAQEGRQYEPYMLHFPSAVTQISGLVGRRCSNNIHHLNATQYLNFRRLIECSALSSGNFT